MKEKIQQQLHEYRKQKEQAIANINALDGAIQALERLLREEQVTETEKEKNDGR